MNEVDFLFLELLFVCLVKIFVVSLLSLFGFLSKFGCLDDLCVVWLIFIIE